MSFALSLELFAFNQTNSTLVGNFEGILCASYETVNLTVHTDVLIILELVC